ncbi:DUF5133 domain-containing protein [Streptomyces sp. NPDC048424]|uniref:DUF5133 domain-containing protein n=1 Tax=Streptomyces sp. NPDC048424 TaxID=3155265 RepID=UPI00341E05BC
MGPADRRRHQDHDGPHLAEAVAEDVERALCVSTGTTDVHAALIAARHHLPGTGCLDDSVLVAG